MVLFGAGSFFFNVLSSSAIILLRKIGLTDCFSGVIYSLSLLLANPWVGLWYVIVAVTCCKNF